MGKVGKISVIPKEVGNEAQETMNKSLRQRGLSRAPGTVLMRYPFKEASGRYRTGLDEKAKRVQEMPEGELKEAEITRIIKLRNKLESDTGLDLSPMSSYYNHNSKDTYKVSPIALRDEDNVFNLDDAWQHITWLWVTQLPDIAPSLSAYYKGLCKPDTQFYVNDEDVEDEILFKKKQELNQCIAQFEGFSLSKRRKFARLFDLPIGDSTKDETVYNLVDNFLRKDTIATGVHKGRDPVKIFRGYTSLSDDVLNVRDAINIAFNEQIYRMKENGKVYEGELKVFDSRDDLIAFMIDEDNQGDLLDLQKKIQAKKLQHVV